MEPQIDERSTWRAAAGWFLVAAALRLFFLGRFGLWGDEFYSLENALRLFTPRMSASELAFPLFYLLERGVLELCGLAHAAVPDPKALQWALRIVPALAGAIAAAAAFRCARGFLSVRERHVLAALIAFSPWLLFFSQTARFYTLLLALSTPAAFELLRASREASVKRGVIAAAWLLLAILAHPTALLLLVGHLAAAIAAAAMGVRPLDRGLVRGLVGPALLPLVLAVPAAIWPQAVTKTLGFKWSIDDASVEGVAELLKGIGWNFGPIVAAVAFLGIPTLWRRDRALAVQVVAGVAVPVAALVSLAALGRAVEQRYLIALIPWALLPAAAFLIELCDAIPARARAVRWAVPALALLPYAPSLASEFIDGDRHDLAGAAELVRSQLADGDGIVAETHALFGQYLPPDFPTKRLIEAPPYGLEERSLFSEMWEKCPRIWVVVPAQFENMNDIHRAFQEWAWCEGRLVRELWRPRLDYHQNPLRIFLVEPARAEKWDPQWRPG